MFGRTIPALADFQGAATPDASAVLMAGRMAEREGFEPDTASESDQQLAESESNPIPSDPRESP